MSAENLHAVTWDDFYQVGRRTGFQHINRLKADVDELKPACKEMEPYVYEDHQTGALLVVKGKMFEPEGDKPAVYFVITLQPQYPNAYPIFSVEEPKKEGWVLKNTPNVDAQGLCYLQSITQWNPRQSKLFTTCAELQTAMQSHFPFEKKSGGAPRHNDPAAQQQQQRALAPAQPQPAAPQPQQHAAPYNQTQYAKQPPAQPPAPQPAVRAPAYQQSQYANQPPQQQPTQQQLQYQQQQTYQQQQYQRQQQQQHHPQRQNTDVFTEMKTGAVVATMGIMGALAGPKKYVTAAKVIHGVNGQKQQLMADRQRSSREEELQKAAQYQVDQFNDMLKGAMAVPPRAEIILPQHMGFQRLRLGQGPQDVCRMVRNAPCPGPPIPHPTPDELKDAAKEAREIERKKEAEQSAKTKSSGFFGKSVKLLGSGVRAMSGAVDSARNTVEDKVRTNYASSDSKLFAERFPEAAPHEEFITQYPVKVIGGDGQGYKGNLFLTKKAMFFSGKDSTAPPQTNAQEQPMIQQHFWFPLADVAVIIRGHLGTGSSNADDFLHIVLCDNSVRSFYNWDGSVTGSVQGVLSGGPNTTPCYKMTNFIDHAWRAATQVPNPRYQYDMQHPMTWVPLTLGGPKEEDVQAKMIVEHHKQQEMAQKAREQPALYQPGGATATATATGGAVATTYQPPTTTTTNQPPPASSTSRGDSPAPAPDVENTCAVCMDQPKNAFLRPCGHVCVCMSCAKQLKACPICRSAIKETFQAFL